MNAGIGFECAAEKFDCIQRHTVEIAQRDQRRTYHALERLGRRQSPVQAESLQIAIDADEPTRAMNHQFVLHRPRVPRNVHAARRVLGFDEGMPLVEEQMRVAPCRTEPDVDVLDFSDERFHEVQTVNTEVLERVPASAIRRWNRSTRVRRVIRIAKKVHRENVAHRSRTNQIERAQDNRIHPCGVIRRQHAARGFRGRDHHVAVGDGLGHRLFDEDVTAQVHGANGEVAVQSRRRQDMHDVRLGRGEFLQTLEHGWDAKLCGDLVRPGLVGVRDADHGHVVQALQRTQMISAHIAGSNNAGPNRTSAHSACHIGVLNGFPDSGDGCVS